MKNKKIILPLLIVIFIINISSLCFAIDVEAFKPEVVNYNELPISVTSILGLIQWIGIAVAVAYLIFMGIKFTIGSIDDKAEIKKHIAPFLIGLVIIIGVSTFAKAIINFVDGINTPGQLTSSSSTSSSGGSHSSGITPSDITSSEVTTK